MVDILMAFAIAMLLNMFKLIGIWFYRMIILVCCITVVIASLFTELESIGDMNLIVWICFVIIFDIIIDFFIKYIKKYS